MITGSNNLNQNPTFHLSTNQEGYECNHENLTDYVMLAWNGKQIIPADFTSAHLSPVSLSVFVYLLNIIPLTTIPLTEQSQNIGMWLFYMCYFYSAVMPTELAIKGKAK